MIRAPRPLARACERLSVGPPSTKTRATRNSSTSAPSLCSALAMADYNVLRSSLAAFFWLNSRTSIARATGNPRMRSATSRPFCGESRAYFITAVACMTYFFSSVVALRVPECTLKLRVAANSPSLWPTMFSVTRIGTCCLPLCTAIVSPTKSGVMVERRDQVLISFFDPSTRALSTFFTRWASTNGPFLTERGTGQILLFLAPLYDHAIGALVVARPITLGRRTPWALRVIAALAEGRTAFDMHPAHLAGAQPQLRIVALARDELDSRARGTSHLGAASGLQFHTVHGAADRDVLERQAVARFDRRLGTRHDPIVHARALGGDDVATLAVGVEHERKVGAAVRIVLDMLDAPGDAVLVAPEIDHTVMALMPTTLMAHADAPVIVTAATAVLLLQKRRMGLATVQLRAHHLDQRAYARGGRSDFYQCHFRLPFIADR